MADRPFWNPWPSPPVTGSGGGVEPSAGVYADPAYIAAVLGAGEAPTYSSPQQDSPWGETPSGSAIIPGSEPTEVTDYTPGAGLEEMIPYWADQPGKLTRAQLDKLLGEHTAPQGLFALGLGSLGKLFVHTRRVTRATRLTKDIGRLLELALRRAMLRGLGGFEPPPTPPPSGPGLPIIRPQIPGFGWGTVAARLSGVLTLLWPNPALQSSTLFPGVVSHDPRQLRSFTGVYGFVGPVDDRVPSNQPGFLPGSFSPPTTLPNPEPPPWQPAPPPGSSSWRQRFEQRLKQRVLNSEQELNKRLGIGKSSSSSSRSPAPEPARTGVDAMVGPRQMAGTTPTVNLPGQQPAPRRSVIRLGELAGAIGVGLLVEALHGGGATAVSPGPAAPPVVTPTPPVPNVAVQPGFQPAALSYLSGGYEGAYCTPRARGPRRKCLERGPVRWSGGRNKGKSAGSKCIRFAGRAT